MNTLRTGILMAAMTGLFLAVGALVGGGTGMLIAFGMALAMNLFAYWNSDKVLLSMYGAQPVDAQSAPELYRLVEKLARGDFGRDPAVFRPQLPVQHHVGRCLNQHRRGESDIVLGLAIEHLPIGTLDRIKRIVSEVGPGVFLSDDRRDERIHPP